VPSRSIPVQQEHIANRQLPMANVVELPVDILGTNGAPVELESFVQLATYQLKTSAQKQYDSTLKFIFM